MPNECIGCFGQHELNTFGVCLNCWKNRLTPGERVLARSLHHVLVVQDGQDTLGIEIAQLQKAIENLARLIKVPSDELDEAIGTAKRLMKAFESRLKRDENGDNDGGEWKQ